MTAILRGEKDGEQLAQAIIHDENPKMSAATAVELYAVTEVRGEPAQRRRVDNLLAALKIRIVPFDEEQAHVARDAYRDFGKGSGNKAGLNFGDCLTYALAAQTGEPLAFTGKDFTYTDLQLVQFS